MASLLPQTSATQDGDASPTSELASMDAHDSTTMANSLSAEEPTQYPSSASYPAVTFKSNTIAPSPPPNTSRKSKNESLPLSALTTSSNIWDAQGPHPGPLSAGLPLQIDVIPDASHATATDSNSLSSRKSTESTARSSNLIGFPPPRTPSIKSFAGSYIASAPSSAFSSPMLNAMPDVTPLPSPLMCNDSPGPWKKLISRPTSREYVMPGGADSALVTASGESISTAILNQTKRRAYHGLVLNASESNDEKKGEGHARNRSVSEYVPEAVQVRKSGHQTVSGSHVCIPDPTPNSISPIDTFMRRERNLAVERGIAPPLRQESILPTPPASRTGGESSDSDSSLSNTASSITLAKRPRYDYFEAYTLNDEKRRRWRALKLLGRGTFSKVILATSQAPEEEDRIDENLVFGQRMDGITAPMQPKTDRKNLVAIKICEHGPKGGASEERVEMSLKRELEIMKSINHPSLVHLRAWNIEETRAILVLSYCAGGDLFEVASEHHELLVPSLLRRMFAELVAAIQYLHERHIVHRDIKLENVLVNLPWNELAKPTDWSTYPYSVVTLTDLGLSRRVADDEKLTTRCGSDDYAAPEVIMGQPYDGRAVDAWSLGVLLYALLESRLPFDPTPGMPEGHKQRSKTSHRIARVEWCWVLYAGNDGDHDGDVAKFEQAGLKGAMEATEGLLKRARSRWTISKVANQTWVRDAISVEGGIIFREEENPQEVSN